MMTLAEMNARRAEIIARQISEYTADFAAYMERTTAERLASAGYRAETTISVGRYGSSGKHTHIINVDHVTEIVDTHRASRNRVRKVGQPVRVDPACNGNTGGASGWIYGKLDTADVTCSKCRKRYGLDS